MANRRNIHRRTKHRRRNRGYKKTMRGGDSALQQLLTNGFTQNQIDTLIDLDVTLNQVMQKINSIKNQEGFSGNDDDVPEQVIEELLNENIFNNQNNIDAIPHAQDDDHNL